MAQSYKELISIILCNIDHSLVRNEHKCMRLVWHMARNTYSQERDYLEDLFLDYKLVFKQILEKQGLK
jgi:hypothetical protein